MILPFPSFSIQDQAFKFGAQKSPEEVPEKKLKICSKRERDRNRNYKAYR